MSIAPDNLVFALGSAPGGKAALERRIAELALGIITALRSGELPVGAAWDELFNLNNYRAAKKKRLSSAVLEMLEWGLELENVAEIAPRALNESCQRIEQFARQIFRAAPPRTGL